MSDNSVTLTTSLPSQKVTPPGALGPLGAAGWVILGCSFLGGLLLAVCLVLTVKLLTDCMMERQDKTGKARPRKVKQVSDGVRVSGSVDGQYLTILEGSNYIVYDGESEQDNILGSRDLGTFHPNDQASNGNGNHQNISDSDEYLSPVPSNGQPPQQTHDSTDTRTPQSHDADNAPSRDTENPSRDTTDEHLYTALA